MTATDNHGELCTIGASAPPLGTHSPVTEHHYSNSSVHIPQKGLFRSQLLVVSEVREVKEMEAGKMEQMSPVLLKKEKTIPVRSFVTGFNGDDGSHRDSPGGLEIQGHLAEDVLCTVVRQLDKSVAVLTPLSTFLPFHWPLWNRDLRALDSQHVTISVILSGSISTPVISLLFITQPRDIR